MYVCTSQQSKGSQSVNNNPPAAAAEVALSKVELRNEKLKK